MFEQPCRGICAEPEDYANDIEPSVVGGAKSAAAIVQAVKGAPSAAWKGRAS
jgi:hypothetical protein